MFNACTTAQPPLYENLVHESGHILGFQAGRAVQGWEDSFVVHHPSIAESVMSYEGRELKKGESKSALPDDPDCSPHPLDVLVVYALYQQESGT